MATRVSSCMTRSSRGFGYHLSGLHGALTPLSSFLKFWHTRNKAAVCSCLYLLGMSCCSLKLSGTLDHLHAPLMISIKHSKYIY